MLLQKFKFVRGTSPLNKEKNPVRIDDIYHAHNGDRTVSAIGLDHAPGITGEMIDQPLKRIIKKEETVLFFAHTPDIKGEKKVYSFRVELLKSLFEKVRRHDISFIRCGS